MIGRGHRGRTDANHNEIVKALRAVGCSVQSLATVGHGCPDLLVGRAGNIWLMEIKSGEGKLTASERDWIANWTGPTVWIVRAVNEALDLVR